jgi:hypothetical protein
MNNCCDCSKRDELDICKLHAEKAKIDCLCASNMKGKSLNVMDEVANNICAQKVQAKLVEAMTLNANDLCSQRATINELCVDNLIAPNFQGDKCEKFRAAVTLAADQIYNLQSPLNWNVILDDPNSNVAVGPFSYTVPESGYYLLNYHLESDSLAGSSVISGIPTGVLNVTVNGSALITNQSAYLSFTGLQKTNLTSLVLLNMGDVLHMNYEVLSLDPVLGLVSYVGTVSAKGNGLLPGKSFFTIHFQSSLNCQPGDPCISVGQTDANGNASGVVPGGNFAVGQYFTIGAEVDTIVSAVPGAQPMSSTGPSSVHTFDISNGAYVIVGAPANMPIRFCTPSLKPVCMTIGQTNASGDISGIAPGGSFSVGQYFMIGAEKDTIVSALPGYQQMASTGPSTIHLFDINSGSYIIAGAPVNAAVLFCQPSSAGCKVCPPVQTPCSPIEVDCHNHGDMQCLPMNSANPIQCIPCNPCNPGSR